MGRYSEAWRLALESRKKWLVLVDKTRNQTSEQNKNFKTGWIPSINSKRQGQCTQKGHWRHGYVGPQQNKINRKTAIQGSCQGWTEVYLQIQMFYRCTDVIKKKLYRIACPKIHSKHMKSKAEHQNTRNLAINLLTSSTDIKLWLNLKPCLGSNPFVPTLKNMFSPVHLQQEEVNCWSLVSPSFLGAWSLVDSWNLMSSSLESSLKRHWLGTTTCSWRQWLLPG